MESSNIAADEKVGPQKSCRYFSEEKISVLTDASMTDIGLFPEHSFSAVQYDQVRQKENRTSRLYYSMKSSHSMLNSRN